MRVFLSYSRKDAGLVALLAENLTARGVEVDYDQSSEDPSNVALGISAEDLWWERLKEMIIAADVIVFSVSPDSIRSPVCDEEVAFAQSLKKRIIPILVRPIDFAKAPPRLSALNIKIRFDDPSSPGFGQTVDQLVAAVNRDVRWFRKSTQITATAKLWADSGSIADHLLQGVELREAEDWAARRPASAPVLPEFVLSFLSASRAAEEERKTIGEVERARYLELIEILKPLLEAEIDIRESMPVSDHGGTADEQRAEIEKLKGLLSLGNKWHPAPPVHRGSLGADQGYAEVFSFTCCNTQVKVFDSAGQSEPPSQFRPDGCRDIPGQARHTYSKRSNAFSSVLAQRHRGQSK